MGCHACFCNYICIDTSVGFSEIDGAASSKGGSISQTYSQGTREEPQRNSVKRLDLEYDRVKELEDKIEVS